MDDIINIFSDSSKENLHNNISEIEQIPELEIEHKPMNFIYQVSNSQPVNPMVSIVMAYHNRIEQLRLSLESISHTKYNNFEVIIVDDASDDFHSAAKIIDSYDYRIKVLSITKAQKRWINPCIAYNLGFMVAQGDIIIIQNPEIAHIGDIVTHTVNNIKDETYLVYSVFSSPSFTYNRYFYSMNSFDTEYVTKNFINKIDHNKFKFDYTFYRTKYEDTKKMSGKNALLHWNTIGKGEGRQCNESGIYFVDGAIKTKGWYNHPIHNNRSLNFLSAIKRNDLDKIGGFDPIFKNGLWYDDDDFLGRIKRILQIVNIDEKNVFGVHLYHDMGSSEMTKIDNFESLRLRNRKFKKRNDRDPVFYRDRSLPYDYKKYSLISNHKNNIIVE